MKERVFYLHFMIYDHSAFNLSTFQAIQPSSNHLTLQMLTEQDLTDLISYYQIYQRMTVCEQWLNDNFYMRTSLSTLFLLKHISKKFIS